MGMSGRGAKQNVIAVDFDEVLIHFNESFRKYHNQVYGTNVEYEDINVYNLAQVYQCDNDVIQERVKHFYQLPDHEKTPPVPGSVEAIKYLRPCHHLEVVTSRADAARDHTIAWAEQHFPNTFRELHFTNGFGARRGDRARSKSEVCEEIGAAVLIDDALKHAEEVALRGIPVLLLDRPWNRENTPDGVVRVTSWEEIVSWIRRNL